MVASRKAVLALATLLAVAPAQACGGGPSRAGSRSADRTVIELAAALHAGQDEAALVRVLQEANGGGTQVPARVADELLVADNVAGRIVAGTDDAVDYACVAFDNAQVVIEAGGAEAQRLLTDMWAELSTGRVDSDTISLACTIHSVLVGQ